MKKTILIILVLIFAMQVAADCVTPENKMKFNESATFCPGNYDLADGIAVTGNAIEIDCNNAILQGTYNGSGIGIFVQIGRTTVRNCIVKGYKSGIYLSMLEDALVEDNVVENSSYGIYVFQSQNSTVNDNQISKCKEDGIGIDQSFNLVISGNDMFDNLNGIYLYSNSFDNLIFENQMIGNTFGIFIDNGKDNIIKDNEIKSNEKNGIHLLKSEKIHIENNIVNENGWSGIVIDKSDDSVFVKNSVNKNDKTGFYLANESDNNVITENDIKNNMIYSVYVEKNCMDNEIFNNIMYKTDVKDFSSTTDFCKLDLMNRYYDGASGPGCLDAPVNVTPGYTENDSNLTIEITFDPIIIAQETIETIVSSASMPEILEKLGISITRLDIVSKLYEETLKHIKLLKSKTILEVLLNGSRQNHTSISLVIVPNETLYNFSVYEQMPEPVNESDIEFNNEDYVKVNDYVYLWNFSILSKPVNLSYVVNRLLDGDPITFPFAERIGEPKQIISIPEPIPKEVIKEPETKTEPTVETVESQRERPDESGNLMIIVYILIAVLLFGFVSLMLMIAVRKRAFNDEEVNQMLYYVQTQIARGVTKQNMHGYLSNLGYDEHLINEIFKRLS